ncbi:hypothetical protein NRB20_30660 [Nocardia sp. RB20]|uniref:Uncharacterized protein n=1 Tax=Nocardia macrotermitis TaxID=2585198 RepID=A0A7K0D2T7_9NOCA|nr:hypothetical protein [Nocardia macrotermitis]
MDTLNLLNTGSALVGDVNSALTNVINLLSML